MTKRRTIGLSVAMLFQLLGILLPDSSLAEGLRYLGLGYILIDLILRVRDGYRRRRPHWTADSWRRYLKACSVPVGAFVIVVLMMFALEWRLPIVGASRSIARGFWAAGTLAFMIIGAGGLIIAIEWLHDGDPSRSFALPRWLGGKQCRT